MPCFSPRISPRLLRLVGELADARLASAEICRRAGAEAGRLGLPQPSYESVRLTVKARRHATRQPSLSDVALDVAFRVRPPEAIVEQLAGTLPPERAK